MTECRPAPRPRPNGRPNGRFARSAGGSRRDLGPGCEGAIAPQGPRLQAPREESPPRQRSTSERRHRLPLPGAARPRLRGRHGRVSASLAVEARKISCCVCSLRRRCRVLCVSVGCLLFQQACRISQFNCFAESRYYTATYTPPAPRKCLKGTLKPCFCWYNNNSYNEIFQPVKKAPCKSGCAVVAFNSALTCFNVYFRSWFPIFYYISY